MFVFVLCFFTLGVRESTQGSWDQRRVKAFEDKPSSAHCFTAKGNKNKKNDLSPTPGVRPKIFFFK